MNDRSRKIIDSSFSKLAKISLALMCAAVAAFTLPIIIKGAGAFLFTATSEHEKILEENFGADLSDGQKERIKRGEIQKEKIFSEILELENRKSLEAQKIITDEIDAAFVKLQKQTDSVLSAAKLTSSKRRKAFADISTSIWGDFASRVKEATQMAEKNGAAVSFEKFLEKCSEDITERAKQYSGSKALKARIKPVARAALRRSICQLPNSELELSRKRLSEINAAYFTFKSGVNKLLGPVDAKQKASEKLPRNKYGQSRMDMARKVFEESVCKIRVIATDKNGHSTFQSVQTKEYFKGTPVEKIFDEIEENFDALMQPHFVFYGGFFTNDPVDSNLLGGIFPMIVGTFYLTLGSMLIAAPLGIIAAIYFSEYAKPSKITSALKMCVGTLAGVPSIVFGLFGLAFLIDTLKISDGKSVIAGSATLALLILPTIVQSCAESLKSVPQTYREASLGLGAGKWYTICTVILPAALPSMLTGIIISMGRAAGETAPIIFTAATSTGVALGLSQIFTNPTPALPWNIYNICSEHEAAEMVEHVQYGMVFTLMGIVLSLNLVAIIIRAKLQRR